MKKYEIEITGKTPYMQHRMDDIKLAEWEKQRGRIIEREEVVHEDMVRALFHMYQDKEGNPIIPSEHIRGALIQSGGFIKAKVGNANRNMKNIIAGMFFVTPEEIKLDSDWIIDKRSAVNHAVKGRVISIRPRWNEWKVNFILSVDNDTITEATIKQLLEYAGNYVGIGSFRPQHNGMFGRFDVTNFKAL